MANNPTGRRLRINTLLKRGSVLKPDIVVQDVDTGEYISGICRMVITLDANRQINEAEVTYYEIDDKGQIATDLDSKVIEHTVKVQNVEIDDITAFEIMDNIRKEMQ